MKRTDPSLSVLAIPDRAGEGQGLRGGEAWLRHPSAAAGGGVLRGDAGATGRRGLRFHLVGLLAAALLPGASADSSAGGVFGAAEPVYFPATSLGKLSDDALDATEGVAVGARNPDLVWVAGGSVLHALGRDGEPLLALVLTGLGSPVADLAAGPGPASGEHYLYLCDTGSPGALGAEIRVLRVVEPSIPAVGGSEADGVLTLRHPDPGFRTGALMVDPWTGDLVVASAGEATTRFFRAPGAAFAAGGGATDIVLAGDAPLAEATAADISPDGGLVAVRSRSEARVWKRAPGETLEQVLRRPGTRAPVAGPPAEEAGTGLAFEQGTGAYLTVSRGKNEHLLLFRPNPSGFGPGVQVGSVADEDLKEISGCAASRRTPGVLWVHNDGAIDRIEAIAPDGRVLAVLPLGRTLTDCEDVAAGLAGPGGTPHLFIGDIGDNDADRSSVGVLVFPEPAVDPAWAGPPPVLPAPEGRWVALRYPSGAIDAETLLHDPIGGELFVVTKEEVTAGIFRLPVDLADPGAGGGDVTTAEEVARVAFPLVSGGDISPDGSRMALRREEFAALWTRRPGQSVGEAFVASAGREVPVMTPPQESNGEAIAFATGSAGAGYYTVGEKKNAPVFHYPCLPVEALVRFASPPAVRDSGCLLRLEGFPGCSAVLESSPDTAAWVPAESFTLAADGTGELGLPPGGAARFFRLRR